jgi:Lrp/AsnC family transcriptional regulator
LPGLFAPRAGGGGISAKAFHSGGVMALDKIDRKILALLQKDATTPVAEIGRKVGLSTTPCWRRIQKMEEDGVIRGRVAILDPSKINAGVTVFVSIKTNEHNEAWMRKFAGVVEDLTEVVEFYRMSGDVDYLLRVVVPDIGAYDAFYKKLIGRIALTDVSSSFAMGQIKYTTALPLEFAIVSDDDK